MLLLKGIHLKSTKVVDDSPLKKIFERVFEVIMRCNATGCGVWCNMKINIKIIIHFNM